MNSEPISVVGRSARIKLGPSKLRSRPLAAFLSLILVSGIFASQSATADNPPRKILSGWLPYYATASGLGSLNANADLIQEVNPFWFTLKSATKISDLYTPANPNMPMLVPLQVMQGLKIQIVPTITDGTAKGVLAGLLSKGAPRAQVVGTILDVVLKNNFDGIDLDFENFAFVDSTSTWPATQPNWIQFVKDLAIALHINGKTLSITTPVLFDPATGKKGYYVYAWADIASVVDRIRIMTYDYSTATPGPIGPITWAESAVKYAVSVIPASKVFLGIAGYGRDWVTKVDGICPANVASVVSPKARAATFVMKDAINLAASYGVVPVYTPKYGESTFTYYKIYSGKASSGAATSCTATRTAWFQDAQGYALRANLVGKYRLGGLAAWTLGMEDPTASEAIRTVAKSIAPDVVVGSIVANETSAAIGEPVTIFGTFQLPDSRPIPSVPVSVEIRNRLGDWHAIYTGITDINGIVAVPVIFAELTSVRMVSEGSWERLAETTNTLDIAVQSKITWHPPSSLKAGAIYSITGRIQPATANKVITFEDASVDLGKNATGYSAKTDGDGNFVIAISIASPGFHKVRLGTTGDDKLAPGFSAYINLLVR